jgi:hypothetical protein
VVQQVTTTPEAILQPFLQLQVKQWAINSGKRAVCIGEKTRLHLLGQAGNGRVGVQLVLEGLRYRYPQQCLGQKYAK